MENITLLKNIFIQLFYKVTNVFGLNRKTVSVICYHSISDHGNKYSIGLGQFKKEITELKKYYKFVFLDEVFSVNKKITPIMSLTFDDGYKDVLSAVEFTQKNNIPVTLFVLSEPEKANRKELNHAGEFLSLSDIKYLHSIGWKIGNHSATHSNFNRLSGEEIENEIVNSKKTLEKKLGFQINYFAYPKGKFNSKIINAVKKAGYKGAFAAFPGVINSKTDRYIIPRFVMEKQFNISRIPAVFSNSTELLRKISNSLSIKSYRKGKYYEI